MTVPGVMVVGSLHYDIVVNAPHMPATDETVMGTDVTFVCGGKGGNQAVAASRHGARTEFAGRVGDDPFARELLSNLEKAAVDIRQVQNGQNTSSGMSVAIVDTAGDYGAVVVSSANQGIRAEDISMSSGTGVLLLQNEIPEAVNIQMAAIAGKAGAKVILNAAPMRKLPAGLLDRVDILVLNRVEAGSYFGSEIAGVADTLEQVVQRAEGPSQLIITLGADGLVSHELGKTAQHIAARKVPVISSHGAGDCFVGAFAARLVAGATDALIYASAAAALHVSTPVKDRMAITPAAVEAFLA